MRKGGFMLLFLATIYHGQAFAVDRVVVEALFTDKAMVTIDGVRRLLKLDKPSPEGVRLISASSKEAVLEVDGERRTYPLGGHITTRFTKPEVMTAKVWRNQAGAYTTVGTINGRTVNFLIDTGATAVAMHANQAKRLGIAYKLKGKRIIVNTASGSTAAYDVMLDRVQVGDISLNNIRGFIIDNNGPARVLLGMSFLNRVKMEDQGTVLQLEKRF